MDKPPPAQTEPPARLSLAEEQRLAFDQDHKRERKPILSLCWSGMLIRN